MSKQLKILFIPIDGIGHVNAAIGIAQVLIERGHKCLFLINNDWKGKLVKYGIEEVLFDNPDQRQGDEDPAMFWAKKLIKGGFSSSSSLEKMIDFRTSITKIFTEGVVKMDVIIEKTINSIIPDVIVLDQIIAVPAVEVSGIPYVWTCSSNPLFLLDDERTPPQGSGLSTLSDKNEWKLFRETVNKSTFDIWMKFNDYVVSKGVKSLEIYKYYHPSPFINIYGFPEELDYSEIRTLPKNYIRFDNLKRTEVQNNFEIPPQLTNKSGKLIYLSLGSMGAVDVEMMKRLVTILSHSSHRYIVSKGPLHSQYELPPNMWGQQTVPQMQVLPIVSLVITHGGNNTVTETFFYGKPLIVLPLFHDQYDNAQQILDKGFGIRLDPHLCSEDELLSAIEKLLNDKELNEKLHKISKRIQTENSIEKLPKLIENLIEMNKQ